MREEHVVGLRLILSAAIVQFTSPSLAQVTSTPPAALQRFVTDYQSDPSITEPFEFGISIDGDWWTVSGAPDQSVEIKPGRPRTQTYSFEMTADTLAQLDSGAVNPLTASGKHSRSEQAPLEVNYLNGYQGDTPEETPKVRRTLFSFWTRGFPERVAIGEEKARPIHGSAGVLLYYGQGFRSVWHLIRTGERIDNHHGRGVGQPWEYLIVVTKAGGGKARIAGKEIKLVDKEAFFVPANAPLDLWNDGGEPLEIILLMFGGKA